MSDKINIAVLAVLAGGLAAEDLPRGKLLDHIAVEGNEQQSYALYLPSGYVSTRKWPILYCLDPGARGRLPLERFSQAAEKAGFIVAGSNNSRNGPLPPVQEAIRAMVMDTHKRLAIDDSRVFAAGFSGGARIALSWAGNGNVAGVVACGAGFGTPRIPESIHYKIFATAGVDDFNYDELYAMSLELARRAVPHRFVEFDDGHDWLPENLASDALEFFEGRLGPLAAQPSKEQEKQAVKFQSILEHIGSASDSDKRSILRAIQKDAAKASDIPARRVARRVIGGVYVSQVETGRDSMAKQDYASAARAYEIAAMARPETGAIWYSLAVAQVARGETRRGLESLEKAAAAGFRDYTRVEQEPLLARIRAEGRYQAVLRTMRGD